ncbi:MAG: tetratricopeptide repeat protein [Acidobacteria bacterium]|nr:tetratricopeptide repeat protein [Acidobacteriota bacterium]
MTLARFELTPLSEIIAPIIADRESGRLTIVSRDERAGLWWVQGDLVLASTTTPGRSLGSFLENGGHVTAGAAASLHDADPADVAHRFFELALVSSDRAWPLLREWTESVVLPLFSLEEGTCAWESGTALEPERRVFIPSTASLVLAGIRAISSGLALKRSVGDLSRRIRFSREPRFALDVLPVNDDERRIAESLGEPTTIAEFVKRAGRESVLAVRVTIEMLTLGVFEVEGPEPEQDDRELVERSERDLAIMSALGTTDERSLRAFAFARHAERSDYYTLLDLPKGATRSNIVSNYEKLRKMFDPVSFPLILRPLLNETVHTLDRAHDVLTNTAKRAEYDRLMAQGRGSDVRAVHKMLARRNIAESNFAKARELVVAGDYHGAMMLLRQTVTYVPDHADAWFLLSTCQQKNPHWKREAMESLQRAISANPNFTEAILTLGDLYRNAGLSARARACYEDVIAIEPENGEAKTRLKSLK